MTPRFRRRLVAGASIVGLVAATAATTAAATTRTSERPPECVTVRVMNPSGHVVWTKWCGTGSGGETPMQPDVAGRGPLLPDGFTFNPAGCGSYANPCIFLWPKSPPS